MIPAMYFSQNIIIASLVRTMIRKLFCLYKKLQNNCEALFRALFSNNNLLWKLLLTLLLDIEQIAAIWDFLPTIPANTIMFYWCFRNISGNITETFLENITKMLYCGVFNIFWKHYYKMFAKRFKNVLKTFPQNVLKHFKNVLKIFPKNVLKTF